MVYTALIGSSQDAVVFVLGNKTEGVLGHRFWPTPCHVFCRNCGMLCSQKSRAFFLKKNHLHNGRLLKYGNSCIFIEAWLLATTGALLLRSSVGRCEYDLTFVLGAQEIHHSFCYIELEDGSRSEGSWKN